MPGHRTPTGLAERCQGALGKPLVIRCLNGWGWTHHVRAERSPVEDGALLAAHLQVVPEGFVPFTTPRGGIYGAILTTPPGYSFKRFLALTMSDGCDYDFTEHIAPAWRVMLGDGAVDYESEWFPILGGDDVYFGYGSVGLNEHSLDLDTQRRREHPLSQWPTRSRYSGAGDAPPSPS